MSLKLEGLQGKTAVVDGNNIRIIKKGGVFSAQREKAIPIRNISSVEVKKPGTFTSGFIQFSIAGGIARDSSFTFTGGAFDAASDENSVLFINDQNFQIAVQIKQYIESESASVSAPPQAAVVSAADEIMKLKTLVDAGILTQDEFAAKKKQLLGLGVSPIGLLAQ